MIEKYITEQIQKMKIVYIDHVPKDADILTKQHSIKIVGYDVETDKGIVTIGERKYGIVIQKDIEDIIDINTIMTHKEFINYFAGDLHKNQYRLGQQLGPIIRYKFEKEYRPSNDEMRYIEIPNAIISF